MTKVTRILTATDVRKAYADGTLKASDVLDTKGQPVNPVSLTGNGPVGARGRIHPAFIAHAEKTLKASYAAGTPKSQPTVTLAVTKTNAKGAKRTTKVEVPTSEARALAGAGKRGRLSAEHLAKAAANYVK